jgi:hypothetical protein
MKNSKILQVVLLTALVIGLAAAPSFAVDYYLIAKEVVKTMPDGSAVTMWGYAQDAGACWNSGSGNNNPAKAARMAAAACTDPVATVPGPRIDVPNNGLLRIFLVNLLPEPTSIVIPGQEMPYSAPNNGPTWTSGPPGPRTSADQRVRSFGRDAPHAGGVRGFAWSPNRSNTYEVGTYLYHSGTHPQLQVQMGLYGASSRNAPGGQVYSGYSTTAQVDMLFSEIDPALHAAVAAGTYKACTAGEDICGRQSANLGFTTSTLNYKPKYFLINGTPYDPATPGPLAAATVGDSILVRMMNATYRELVPMVLNGYGDLIAENGRPYTVNTVAAGNIATRTNHARQQYAFELAAGSTKDVIFTPQAEGTFWIFDRRLNVSNPTPGGPAATSGGGFRASIEVAAAAP